ncbi:MAG: ATP-binding protein [Gammaproteobacteria bacterium]|nr:ATP-binding protein [Gammaproteobacteria bacterium]
MIEKSNLISAHRSIPKSSYVTEEQVRLLYMQAPISNSVAIIIALLYYFLLQPRIDSRLLLFWLLMLLMTASYRMYLWYRRKNAPESRSATSWLNYYLVGCGLVGGSWSLIYLFIYGTSDPLVLTALLVLAFGVISSAVPILSVYMPAFILYTYPQGLLLAITFLRYEDTAYYGLAFAVGVYLVMTTLFTRNANLSILQSIRLQEQNVTLIEDLNNEINQREALIAQRTLELEKTNNELIIEIKERERTKDRLVQSNANLDATLQAIPDLMFELDETGRYLDVWAHDPELLVAQKEALIGHTVTEVLPADAAGSVMIAIQEAAENGTSHGHIIRLPLTHGVSWFELSTSRKQCADSSSHFLMLSRDITDKQQIEAEKERMQRELQQSRKMESLGHLTGGIAHDFNNLLQVISGFTDLSLDISTNKGETKLIEYLNHLKKATERAANLVSQMLSFSRQERVDSLPMGLASVLRDEVKLLRATLPSTIEIEAEIEDDLPVVLMNPTQLQQMIMNLCVNARDAMDGQGKLGIHLGWIRDLDTVSPVSHKPVKGDWIEIAITDTGSGIEPDIIEDIFTPFYTTKGVGQGTGMGLSVVYGIVENYGGHILVEAEVGKGSRLHMLFPPITETASPVTDSDKESTMLTIVHGENILVVDDEKSIAMLLKEILSNHGYQPIAVTDSTEALTLFKADPDKFDMLITDQTMPKLTGIELITQLREIRPNLPAILCTGFSDKISDIEAENQNIQFFNKPVDTNMLIQKIALLFSANHEKKVDNLV